MSALIVRVLLRRPTSQTFRFTPIRTLIVPRRHGVRIRTNHPFARLGARICRGHSAHRHARVRRRFLIKNCLYSFYWRVSFCVFWEKEKRTKFPKFQIFDAMMMRFCNHHHHHRLQTIDSIPFRSTFYSSSFASSSFDDLFHRYSKEDKENNTNLKCFLPLLTPPFVSTVDPTRTRVRTRTRPRRRSPCLFSALSLLSCCCCCSLCFWIWIWRLRARRRQQPGHPPSRGSPCVCFVAILLRKRRKLVFIAWFMTSISITSSSSSMPSLFDNTFY